MNLGDIPMIAGAARALEIAGVAVIVGGVLVVGSDLLCRSLLPAGLSVGVVTAGIGGPFLIYLMIAVSRKASA